MVAQLTPEVLDELDRTQGAPVHFEDPRTHARYVLIPQDAFQRVSPLITNGTGKESGPPSDWSEDKNARRCELIKQKYAAGLSAAEEAELTTLQQEMYRYRAHVAPLPLDMLDLVREGLERRAAERQATPAP